MINVRGEVYPVQWHPIILSNEQESVRKWYPAVARAMISYTIRITKQQAADMIDKPALLT